MTKFLQNFGTVTKIKVILSEGDVKLTEVVSLDMCGGQNDGSLAVFNLSQFLDSQIMLTNECSGSEVSIFSNCKHLMYISRINIVLSWSQERRSHSFLSIGFPCWTI